MGTQGLAAICTTLGVAEEDDYGNCIGYSKGDSCLDNLKDLLRFLRRDDPQTREVFKQVCKWKIVSKDLVPIIRFHQNDRNLVLNAVKVLVFLTMPIEASSNDVIEQTEYLWRLKSAIASSDLIAVIVSLLEGPLENLQQEVLTEEDWKLVQLVMTFFRNLLAIQDFSLMLKVGGSTNQLMLLRDRFLELLFQENVMDIILVITENVGGSHCYFRQDNLLLLEIFHYIFMGQDPQLIAKAGLNESKAGGDIKASLDGLKSIMEEEEEKKRLSRQRNVSRHLQFSGTFTRLTMDGSKAICKGNLSSNSRNILLRRHEAPRGPSKKIVWDNGRLPPVKGNILGLLHDFLNMLLSGGYNVLMQSVHDDIEKETQAIQNSDIVVFFQMAQFVTSFQYHKFLLSKPNMEKDASNEDSDKCSDRTLFNGDMCGPIAASMNESIFLLVLSRWRYAFDGLKETHDYRFLSAAGSLMKTMIRMLDLVLKLLPEDSKEPQTARILLYKLFYDQTDQGMTHFLLNLIKSFDSHKQPKSDLSDLVEMVHIMIRLIENLQARGTLRVSKKVRRQRKKKEGSNKEEAGTDKCDDELPTEHKTVHHIGTETNSEVLQQKTSEDTNSQQQESTNLPNQVDEPEKSVPEGDNRVKNMPVMNNTEKDITYDMSSSSEDFSEDEQPSATYEVDFKVSTLASAFASHSMIKNLCWLLSFYKSNSISTNHYIISVLRRITDDLELSPILYQLSLLTTFYDILEEQKSSPCKEYAEIVEFLTTLVRRMLRKMKSQPFLFVEVLFWKSRRECHYINAEHLLHELGSIRKHTSKQGSASAFGEAGSFHNEELAPRNIADALGDDEADVVISYNQGYHKEGNTMEDQIGEVPKRKRRLVLTEELGSRIKELYEKYKDDENCCREIAECLGPHFEVSPAQIFNKLKQLGLSVVSKKRMWRKDRTRTVTPDTPGEEGNSMGEGVEHHESINAEVSVDQSQSNRKRRRALGKDQEEMIKSLFEQFKDNKRCNHMIANALAADNSFTAAQVARKLKQLGLKVTQRKISEMDVGLRDEEQIDFGTEVDSDNETLLSLRNRKQLQKQNIYRELSEDSDNELLGSILKKTRKVLPKGTENLASSDEDTGHDAPTDNTQRDVGGQSVAMQYESQGVNEEALLSARVEAEATGPADEDHLGVSSVSKDVTIMNEDNYDDELEDSEDDTTSRGLTIDAMARRKLKMVVDYDEDDDD